MRTVRRAGSPSHGPEPVEEEELRRGQARPWTDSESRCEEEEEQARRGTGGMERDIDPSGEPHGGGPRLTKNPRWIGH
jgi:hypothetical protein